MLKAFLNWFKNSKRFPNLTGLVNVNMPNNAGKKLGTRKRKGASNKPTPQRKNSRVNRLLQPTQSFIGHPSTFQTGSRHLSSFQSATNQFSPSYSALGQFQPCQTAPCQPASRRSALNQLSPYQHGPSQLPPTQSVPNQLVPSQLALHQISSLQSAPSHSPMSTQSAIGQSSSFQTSIHQHLPLQSAINHLSSAHSAFRQRQPHPQAPNQTVSSQTSVSRPLSSQGAVSITLMNNQARTSPAERHVRTHESNITAIHDVSSPTTVPTMSVPARPKPAPGLLCLGDWHF